MMMNCPPPSARAFGPRISLLVRHGVFFEESCVAVRPGSALRTRTQMIEWLTALEENGIHVFLQCSTTSRMQPWSFFRDWELENYLEDIRKALAHRYLESGILWTSWDQ